jgi:hypothetical protein
MGDWHVKQFLLYALLLHPRSQPTANGPLWVFLEVWAPWGLAVPPALVECQLT